MFSKDAKSDLVTALLKFCTLLLNVDSPPLLADVRQAELTQKMDSGEVIRRWGPPVFKESREVKRQDIWYYNRGISVTFLDGEVTEWMQPNWQLRVNADSTVSPRPLGPNTKLIDDLLNEIQAAGEKEPASASGSASRSAEESSSAPPPPMNMYQPPPVIGGPEIYNR